MHLQGVRAVVPQQQLCFLSRGGLGENGHAWSIGRHVVQTIMSRGWLQHFGLAKPCERCMPCEEVVVRAWLRGVCGVPTMWLKTLMFELEDPRDARRKAVLSPTPTTAHKFWFARKFFAS